MDYSTYLVKALEEYVPAYKPIKNLIDKKNELAQLRGTGIHGGDNYYHRLAMCENAQNGRFDAAVSRAAGLVNEMKDIYCKTSGKCGQSTKPFLVNLKESMKDLRNNDEGINLGLQNPEISCKILLQDLDWETNTWKKPRK